MKNKNKIKEERPTEKKNALTVSNNLFMLFRPKEKNFQI